MCWYLLSDNLNTSGTTDRYTHSTTQLLYKPTNLHFSQVGGLMGKVVFMAFKGFLLRVAEIEKKKNTGNVQSGV